MAQQFLGTSSNPGVASWSDPVDSVIARTYTGITITAGSDEVQIPASGEFGKPVLITFEGTSIDATLTAVTYSWLSSPGDIISIRGNNVATANVSLTVVLLTILP